MRAVPGADLSDEQLVARIRSEADPRLQQDLTGELFARHYQTVARWCLRLCGDREQATDLAQDVFLKAHRNLASFRLESKFTTWLYVITRNESFNRFRANSTEPADAGDPMEFDPPDQAASPETLAERDSLLTAARQLMFDHLDETERRVFTLHYAQELPLAAITQTLGLTNQSGAKAYIVSARRKLSQALPRWRARSERGRTEGVQP